MKYTAALALAVLTAAGYAPPPSATSSFPVATSGMRAGRWTALDGYRNGLIADPKGVYVDPARPTSGNGSSASQAVRTINEALGLLSAGVKTRVWIKAGSTETRSTTVDWPAAIGGTSQSDPAGIFRFGAGARPIIECSERTVTVLRVFANATDWIGFVGLHVRAPGAWVGSETYGTGIEFRESATGNALIEHCVVEGVANGILCQGRQNWPTNGTITRIGNLTIRFTLVYNQASRTAAVADANPNGTTDSVTGPWGGGVDRPRRTGVALSCFNVDEITIEDNVLGMSASQWSAGASANHNVYCQGYSRLTCARNICHGAGLCGLNLRNGGLSVANVVVGSRFSIAKGSSGDNQIVAPHSAAVFNAVTRSLYAAGSRPSERDDAQALGQAISFDNFTIARALFNFIADGYIGTPTPANPDAQTTPVDCFPFRVVNPGLSGTGASTFSVRRNYVGRWQRPPVQGDMAGLINAARTDGSFPGTLQRVEIVDNIIDNPCVTNLWYGFTGFPTFVASGNVYRTPLSTDIAVDGQSGYAARNAAWWSANAGETIQTSASTVTNAPLWLRQYAASAGLGTTEGDVFDAAATAYLNDQGDAPVTAAVRADSIIDFYNTAVGLFRLGPAAPTGVTLARVSQGIASFSFTAAPDADVVGYDVQASSGGDFAVVRSTLVLAAGGGVRTGTIAINDPGQTFVRVRARWANQVSPWSEIATINTWPGVNQAASSITPVLSQLVAAGTRTQPTVLAAGIDPAFGFTQDQPPTIPAALRVDDSVAGRAAFGDAADQIARAINGTVAVPRCCAIFNGSGRPAKVAIAGEVEGSAGVTSLGRIFLWLVEPAPSLPGARTDSERSYTVRSMGVIALSSVETPSVSGRSAKACTINTASFSALPITQISGGTVRTHAGTGGLTGGTSGVVTIDGLPQGCGLVIVPCKGTLPSPLPENNPPELATVVRPIVQVLD